MSKINPDSALNVQMMYNIRNSIDALPAELRKPTILMMLKTLSQLYVEYLKEEEDFAKDILLQIQKILDDRK